MRESEVRDEFTIGQHGALLSHLGTETRHGRIVHRVGGDLTLATERVEHDANRLPHVGHCLPALAARLAVVERFVDVASGDRRCRGLAEGREGVQPQASQLVASAANAIGHAATVNPLRRLLERLDGQGRREGRGLGSQQAFQLALCGLPVRGLQLTLHAHSFAI